MLDELYYNVKDFNNMAKNIDTTVQGFRNQQKLVYEEAIKEVEDALKDGDIVKVLDGVVDGLYVLLGQLQKLDELGCDVAGAIEQVCKDNMTKFPTTEEHAAESVLHYNKLGTMVFSEYNSFFGRWVLFDENRKVRKPVGFTSTDLSKYVPKSLQEKGLVK